MLRALLWKEWKQLGSLRWGSVGAGAVLPLVTIAAGRGIGGAGTDLRTLVQDLLPVLFCLGAWPLFALMLFVQALSADRTGGTAPFLLERPVRRNRVWAVRLIAALLSLLVVIAAHLVFWRLLTTVVGGPGTTLASMAPKGALACVLAVLAGMAAAPLVRTPMQGVLLGLVLGALPIGVGALLVRGFAGFRLHGFALGWLVPLLLVVGYTLVSYTMECRGEPAGRGRIRRGLVVLGAAALAMPLSVVLSAPGVLQLDARLGLGNTAVYPAPHGNRAFVHNLWQGAGWLIDSSTGRRLRFFPPDVWSAAWNEDGTRIALLHDGANLGRTLADPRIEIVDAADGAALGSFDCETCPPRHLAGGFSWAAGRIVVDASVEGSPGIVVLDPTLGERNEVRIPGLAEQFGFARTGANGELLIVATAYRKLAYRSTIYRLDAARSRLVAVTTLDDSGLPYYAKDTLSPSGRYWLKKPSLSHRGVEIIEIGTGARTALPTTRARWIADDRLIWIEATGGDERRLLLGWPGDAREISRFSSEFDMLEVSPDRGRVILSHSAVNTRSVRIVDTGTGEAASFELPSGNPSWADNHTLALTGQGYLCLVDLDSPAQVKTVLGSR